MSQVHDIAAFRANKRRQFLLQNGKRLTQFIRQFVRLHLNSDLHSITANYLASCQRSNTESWDYLDMREELSDIIRDSLVEQLVTELRTLSWYEPGFLTNEEITERCLSVLVLEDWAAIS